MRAAAGSPPAKPAPQFGISVTGTNPYLVEDIGPYDFATIYNILPLWNAGIDGSGQTIAIAGTSSIVLNDVATFRNFFLPSYTSTPAPTLISGNSSPLTVCSSTTGTLPFPTNPCTLNDLLENTLDVEWSGSVAPKAQIVLVSSYPSSTTDDSLYDSESYIVNHLTARIMNVSYGECELALGTAGNVQYYNLWQTAASEGIAVFVASGDSGSASCDAGGDSSWRALSRGIWPLHQRHRLHSVTTPPLAAPISTGAPSPPLNAPHHPTGAPPTPPLPMPLKAAHSATSQRFRGTTPVPVR